MGTRSRVIPAFVLLIAGCGGRSRSDAANGRFPGAGGAAPGSGGATAGVVTGSGAASSGGQHSVCGHRIVDYVASSASECAGLRFVCAPGTAVFVDDCGCGCDAFPFGESTGMIATDTRLGACNGPSGPIALFETSPQHLIIAENSVHVRVERRLGQNLVIDWAIDKRTADVSLGPPWSELSNAPGSVVSGPDPLELDGVIYARSPSGKLTMAANGEVRELFELPGYDPEFIVVDSEVYTTSYDGALFRGLVDPVSPPKLVERRGELDDDDPYPVIVGADEDAIYWTAGPYTDGQVTDGDPSMLYRTCR